MIQLSTKTDLYQLLEKDYPSSRETKKYFPNRLNFSAKNLELVGVRSEAFQYDWNHMTKYDLIILLFKQKIYEYLY